MAIPKMPYVNLGSLKNLKNAKNLKIIQSDMYPGISGITETIATFTTKNGKNIELVFNNLSHVKSTIKNPKTGQTIIKEYTNDAVKAKYFNPIKKGSSIGDSVLTKKTETSLTPTRQARTEHLKNI